MSPHIAYAALTAAVIACVGALIYCLHWARKVGYQDAARRVYEDIRMYREDEADPFHELVPGLSEAMYIAKYHSNNYNVIPTGLSRSVRPGPIPGTTKRKVAAHRER